jgi:hypothetical protein
MIPSPGNRFLEDEEERTNGDSCEKGEKKREYYERLLALTRIKHGGASTGVITATLLPMKVLYP